MFLFFLKKKEMQIGRGGQARILGPFQLSQLQTMFPPDELKDFSKDEKYIVKIYDNCKPWTQSDKKRLIKLKKIPFPEVVVFPLVLTMISPQKIQQVFGIQKKEFSCVEIQPFGGENLFSFFYQPIRNNIPFSHFLEVWDFVKKILANCFVWIYHYHLIITDIKPENMLIHEDNGKWKLKLIDISAYPLQAKSRTITTDLELLPLEYFNTYFKTSENWESRKKKFIQKNRQKYQKDTSSWGEVLRQIHNKLSKFQQVVPYIQSQPQDSLNLTFFLVIYPLFVNILRLIYVNLIEVESDEQVMILEKIRSFCIKILTQRGRVISSSNPAQSMKRFLKEMSLSSHL